MRLLKSALTITSTYFIVLRRPTRKTPNEVKYTQMSDIHTQKNTTISKTVSKIALEAILKGKYKGKIISNHSLRSELKKLSEESLARPPEEVFDIICKLGEGSYGSVYKALHKESGVVSALT